MKAPTFDRLSPVGGCSFQSLGRNKEGSSAESVGDFWLRQVTERVVQGDFETSIRPKAIGLFGGEFSCVVQPLARPVEICPRAVHQFTNKARCVRSERAPFFIGSMRDRITRVHHRSKNRPAQWADR